jgi:hypothetical protein
MQLCDARFAAKSPNHNSTWFTHRKMISDQVKSVYQAIIDDVIEKSVPSALAAGYSGSTLPQETLGRIKSAWIQNLQKELGLSCLQ